ncbi:TonB-dependent receptor domain-containing protein [Massilia sp. CFBP 13647]|uniref:TonB-dependent receptor domain-containing protein n=1 Tax=Massilia sp. CFBP 13647 TaxID=2775276 RepID=UPI00177E3A0E|nr:TonB-dependent receptor [Massilia sp. CFBP 13647]MBD8529030.1 TonB-dependent receptor [Massilia sp. CFBP 13647]MBD8672424.1 TonB-dependent receptor [Massilia sp. CFBP 13721]
MMETILSRSIRVICLSGLAVGMSTAYAQEMQTQGGQNQSGAAQQQAAAAAEGQTPMQRIEVTGSRIASPNADSPSPLQVLSAADIAASGAANLQQVLLDNPTMGSPAISRTNSAFQTASVGVATVDLRNLGTSRTLVLVNGRRFVSGIPGESAVDLNSIPTDFIERVELLTGGSSAAYGSDAVAGVVNIITKRSFNGIMLDAQLGESTKNDDKKRKFSATFGTSNDDGFLMGHLGYSREGQVWSRDRERSAVDQNASYSKSLGGFTVARPFYSSYAPQGTFYPDSGSFTYDRAGNVIPVNTNGANGGVATGFNRNEFRSIAVPVERYLFATNGELKINEKTRAFMEGTYASSHVSTTIEPFALGAEDIFPSTGGQVPAGSLVNGTLVRNPLVPQYLYDRISDNDGDGIPDYYFTRRLSEVGTRGSTAERDTFRFVTGVKGEFDAWKTWNYEVYGGYGQTKEAQQGTGQVNVLNFAQALQAIPGENGGAPVCASADARTQGCVPINVFGFNTISPEALRYVTAPGSLLTRTTQKMAGGQINGEVWDLPAGPLGVAAGVEWRKEFSSAVPDALTQAGLNAGNATPPTAGEFSVREIFLETRVPLLKDMPFVKELNFLGAFRHGDYSSVGSTNSWNAGAEWTVVNDVKLRGTRSLSTRAPNINELYQAPSQDFPSGLIDPCVGVTATSSGQYDALCRAAPGVGANIAANGAFTLTQPDEQGVSGYNRGNQNLQAEKGRSTTFGVVWTPRSIELLKRVTFTADYFNIKIADAILSTPRQYALESCYSGSNPALCSFITRRPAATGNNSAGSLDLVDTAVSNTGGFTTEGIDLTAAWNDRVGPGRLSTKLAYTYVKQGYVVPLPGADRDPFAGEIGAPKNKALFDIGYKWNDVSVSATATYIGRSALDDQYLTGIGLTPGSFKFGSRTYTDLQASYQLVKGTELYFGLNNAFDTKPPAIVSGMPGSDTGAETDAGTYDPIGRRWYAGIRVKL